MAYDLGTARGTIELTYEGHNAVTKANKDMDGVGKKGKETDRALASLGKTFKALGTGVKLGGVAAGLGTAAASAANLAVELLGVVPQLASIASLSSALPGIFVGVAASVGVIKAAMAGVGDTLKAAFDPKGAAKFKEGLKQLSPEAQKFALAVQDNVKALQGYQKGIQEAFFSTSGLTAAVPKVVGLLKQIRPSVQGIATDFGRVTKSVVDFGTNSKTIGFINDSLVAFRQALNFVTPAITPVLEGLRSVGQIGLSLIPRLGGVVADVANKFSSWLSQITASGQLQDWINTAIHTLGTLGDIASNIGGILKTVFSVAADTSGGLLNNIKTITDAFNTFLSSTEGSKALAAIFTGIGAAATALLPAVTTLAGALASALGPALQELATVAGPVLLQVVNALAPALGPVANAIVDVVSALAPLLPPLAQLIAMVATLAGGELTAVASELGPLIQLFSGGLMSALQALAPVIQEALVQGLPLAAAAGQQLMEAFKPLVPIMVEFASTLGQALVENLPTLLDAAKQLVPVLITLAGAIAGDLGQALQDIIPFIPTIVEAFVQFISICSAVQGVLIGLDAKFFEFLGVILSLPQTIGNAISAVKNFFIDGFNNVMAFLGTAIDSIVGFFSGLPAKIGTALAALPSTVGNFIRNAASTAAFEFGALIGRVVTLAFTLPPRIGAAIAALPGQLASVVVNAWHAVSSATNQGIAAAVAFAASLPGRARSAISSLGANLKSIATSAWAALKSAFSSGVANAVNLAHTLPGKIKAAVGNLIGLLAQAGRDAVQGFVNGIKSGVGAAAAAARSLGSSVLSGIKSTLKIGSPSKEMAKIGQFVTQGLTKGMLGTANQVQAASNKLANMITQAFSDKLISKNTKKSILSVLNATTKQMLSLINQSNSISSKLKTAQQNLADVQKSYNDAYASAVQKTKDTFNLVTAGQSFVNLDLTKKRFAEAVDQAKKFAANIQSLAKRGLSKDLIQQLVDSGAADGGAMAAALAGASDATIKQFNAMQSQLNKAADSVGKTTANALYGAGLQAAKGLVDGLTKQQAAIEKAMEKIADALVARIKKALKIKSPSRVMFNVGQFASEGLLNGLASLRRQVEAAAAKLATSSIIPTVQLTASRASAQSQQAAATQQVGGSTFQVNQTVNALPGMSAQQVAKFSLDKLKYALSGGITSAVLPAPSPAGA